MLIGINVTHKVNYENEVLAIDSNQYLKLDTDTANVEGVVTLTIDSFDRVAVNLIELKDAVDILIANRNKRLGNPHEK